MRWRRKRGEVAADVIIRGAQAWAEWRRRNPGPIDLRRARLRNPVLNETTLVRLTAPGQKRSGFSPFQFLALHGIDLAAVDLTEADVTMVDLPDATLAQADCTRARLWQVNLSRADLRGARLIGASFALCDLSDADFTGADLSDAYFGFCSLRGARGLDTVECRRRCQIDPFTVVESQPLSESWIERVTGDLDLVALVRAYGAGIRAKKVFISYSHQDEAVAQWLRRSLLQAGVPCWLAPADLRQRTNLRRGTNNVDTETTRNLATFTDTADCLLLLASPRSAASPWVAAEVERVRSHQRVLSSRTLGRELTVIVVMLEDIANPPRWMLEGPTSVLDFRDRGTSGAWEVLLTDVARLVSAPT
jgi:hypothetical protein